jgi:hypothetical protein
MMVTARAQLCTDAGSIFDFHNPCVRSSWSASVPAAFVLFLCLFSLGFPMPEKAHKIFQVVKPPFKPFLTLHEAEALDLNTAAGDKVVSDEDAGAVDLEVPDTVPLWRAVVFAFVGLVETLSWLSYGSLQLAYEEDIKFINIWEGMLPFLVALPWLWRQLGQLP